MKKTKSIAILALVLVAAMLLGGCGGAKAGGKSDDKVYTFKIDYPNPENSGAYIALTE